MSLFRQRRAKSVQRPPLPSRFIIAGKIVSYNFVPYPRALADTQVRWAGPQIGTCRNTRNVTSGAVRDEWRDTPALKEWIGCAETFYRC